MTNAAPDVETMGKTDPVECIARLSGQFLGTWYPGVMLVSLACPATNDRSPRYMEKALSAIHQGLAPGERVVLSYTVIRSQVTLAIRLDESLASRIIGPILANYPQGTCAPVAEPEPEALQRCVRTLELTLVPQLYPILRHAQFEDLLNREYADPIDSLLAALTPMEGLECRVDFTIGPAEARRVRQARKALSLLEREFLRERSKLAGWYVERIGTGRRPKTVAFIGWLAGRSRQVERSTSLDVSASRTHEREADLLAAADKLGGHLFDVRLRLVATAPIGRQSEADERLRTIAAAFGAFTKWRLARFSPAKLRRRPTAPFLLSNEELATLWHPPTAGVGTERLAVTSFTEREAPATLSSELQPGDTLLGRTCFRTDDRPVILRDEDRRRHVYIVGKTGMGKTTLILNQIQHDIAAGRGLCLIDPHGDLAEAVLGTVPTERTNDVILFDAGDSEHAVSFNPLACPDPRRMDQVASGVVASLRKMYDSWGPRLEDTLRNAVYAAIEQRGTFLTVLRILADAPFREQLVARVQEPIVRAFWQQEFASWHKAYRTEAVAAIQNKIRPFLTNRTVRAIVSQTDRSLDLRRIMDDGKILIVNLSKGRVGEDNAAMLGALLVSSLQEAAMRRADTPEHERSQFSLFVDEFQNFTTGSFATILSEARKYGLTLTISHQYFRQLDERTADAVGGNVGTFVTFAVGSDDAEWLATTMSKSPGQVEPHDLTNLPKYTACVRLLMDGLPSAPFTIRTEPPPSVNDVRREVIRRQSAHQHARPVVEVLTRVERMLS
jgi:hypothetical protein